MRAVTPYLGIRADSQKWGSGPRSGQASATIMSPSLSPIINLMQEKGNAACRYLKFKKYDMYIFISALSSECWQGVIGRKLDLRKKDAHLTLTHTDNPWMDIYLYSVNRFLFECLIVSGRGPCHLIPQRFLERCPTVQLSRRSKSPLV